MRHMRHIRRQTTNNKQMLALLEPHGHQATYGYGTADL